MGDGGIHKKRLELWLVTAEMVKLLRATNRRRARLLKALTRTNSDFETAVGSCAKKGLATLPKKASHSKGEWKGLITYVHPGSKIVKPGRGSTAGRRSRPRKSSSNWRDQPCTRDETSARSSSTVTRCPPNSSPKEKEVYAEQMVQKRQNRHRSSKRSSRAAAGQMVSEGLPASNRLSSGIPDVTIQALLTDRIASLGCEHQVRRFSRFESAQQE